MDRDTQSLWQTTRPRYDELRGRTALVTGSGRGIGKTTALRLAREGMRVVITSNVAADVERTATELTELGAEALPVVADLAHSEELRHLIRATVEAFGTIDLLVNNAALLARGNIFDVDEHLLDAELAVNVKGSYLASRLAAEVMREQQRGVIINLSSVGGIRAHWQGLPYDVTKGAIDAMTRAMAIELASFGIRVNAIAPGAIGTGWEQRLDTTQLQDVQERIPLLRIGTPTDIANMVAFLASNEASYITGQVLYVDGGITAQLSPRSAPL